MRNGVIDSQIDVVSLDAGGTIFEPLPSVGEIYARVAKERHNHPPEPDILSQRFSQIWKASPDFDFSRESWKKIVDFCFEPTHPTGVDDDLFANIYQAFARIENWKLFPDVELALELLRQSGFRIVIASNWDQRLRQLISGFGLDQFFDAVLLSVEVGFTKPDPRFFDAVATRMRCHPSRIIHVGDCPVNDLEGARKSGLSSLLLNRKGPAEAHEIESLVDLCNLENIPSISLEKGD